MLPADERITELLHAAAEGSGEASELLFARVDRELKSLARREFARWKPGATLQATALVSEAYLRLFGRDERERPENRRYFYAAAARVMHDVMIENARRRSRRGPHEGIPTDIPEAVTSEVDLAELKFHIARLEAVDARAAEVFRLRLLVGLPFEEIARTVGVAVPTVERDLRFARTWLRARLKAGRGGGGES